MLPKNVIIVIFEYLRCTFLCFGKDCFQAEFPVQPRNFMRSPESFCGTWSRRAPDASSCVWVQPKWQRSALGLRSRPWENVCVLFFADSGSEVEALTETSLKRMHLQFERKVKLNRELRIKLLDCYGMLWLWPSFFCWFLKVAKVIPSLLLCPMPVWPEACGRSRQVSEKRSRPWWGDQEVSWLQGKGMALCILYILI